MRACGCGGTSRTLTTPRSRLPRKHRVMTVLARRGSSRVRRCLIEWVPRRCTGSRKRRGTSISSSRRLRRARRIAAGGPASAPVCRSLSALSRFGVVRRPVPAALPVARSPSVPVSRTVSTARGGGLLRSELCRCRVCRPLFGARRTLGYPPTRLRSATGSHLSVCCCLEDSLHGSWTGSDLIGILSIW